MLPFPFANVDSDSIAKPFTKQDPEYFCFCVVNFQRDNVALSNNVVDCVVFSVIFTDSVGFLNSECFRF